MKLTYATPAAAWTDALAVGNGRLGAMVFGGIATERLQINDDTCWSGAPGRAADRGADRTAALDRVRFELASGRVDAAEDEVRSLQFGYSESYQPFIDVFLETDADDVEAGSYRRWLDLDTAVAGHRWRSRERQVRQEVFASHPDGVLVLRREVLEGEPMDIRVTMTSPHPSVTESETNGSLSCTIRLPSLCTPLHAASPTTEYDSSPGASITAHAHIDIRHDGRRENDGWVRGARWVELVITSETDFAGAFTVLHGNSEVLALTARKRANAAAMRGVSSLRARHIDDYASLFQRTSLTLGDVHDDQLTDTWLERNRATHDPTLVALLFAYGRYLMIAGSRPGSLPLNLQGIWNDKPRPPWSSNYTTNINVEMNYWPAETAGLSECHEPLLAWLEDLARSGRRTATEVYGMRGWVAHHNSDPWAFSLPAGEGDGDPAWSMWPLASAWLCRHLWDRWDFGRDDRELRDRSYPIMRDAALFLLDWMVEQPDGTLGTAPSTSPENHYLADDGAMRGLSTSTTADRAIARELFRTLREAMRVLEEDDEPLALRLDDALLRLPSEQVARDGRLAEWSTDADDAEPLHRHQSHLYGVYPGDAIVPWRDPELSAAALHTLDKRGQLSTGWSLAWRIGLRARLGDAEGALSQLQQFLRPMQDGSSEEPSMTAPSGVYRNLFCAHPPFQIDGNFGATAAIIEMLVQSHGGRMRLLPALPAAWPSGALRGARARGDLQVSMHWEDRRVINFEVTGPPNTPLRIEYNCEIFDVIIPPSGLLRGPLGSS